DSYSLFLNTTLTVPAPGVLANDTDSGGDTLRAVLVNNVSHGTLVFNANGGFTYTPAADYVGPDSFTYHAHQNIGGLDSADATVTLTVKPASATRFVPIVLEAPG